MTMANSAAAALLSLQMMGSSTKSNMGLKRRVSLSEDDEVDPARVLRLRSDSAPATLVDDSEQQVCVCDVLPEDVLAQCLALLDSFQDIASYVAPHRLPIPSFFFKNLIPLNSCSIPSF